MARNRRTRDRQRRLRAATDTPTDTLFDAREISRFIEDAFATAIRPMSGQLTPARLGYCRERTHATMKAFFSEVAAGNFTTETAVVILLGGALAMQQLQVLAEADDSAQDGAL